MRFLRLGFITEESRFPFTASFQLRCSDAELSLSQFLRSAFDIWRRFSKPPPSRTVVKHVSKNR
jgi:hypothetical protein